MKPMKLGQKQKTHVKIGDRIKIIAGNQKGLLGNIVSLDKKKSKAIIDSVLPKQKKAKDQKIDIQQYIHTSNLMIFDTLANSADKVEFKLINNKKTRCFKKSGNTVENLPKA